MYNKVNIINNMNSFPFKVKIQENNQIIKFNNKYYNPKNFQNHKTKTKYILTAYLILKNKLSELYNKCKRENKQIDTIIITHSYEFIILCKK